MTDFAHARKTMVDNQLRTSAITDHRLLGAMGTVPREKFVPALRQGLAYIDEALPIGSNRKLAAPAPFARLVQLAAIQHDERVLDLGCGTGYSAAVLARLGKEIVAVEDDKALAAHARASFTELGIDNVKLLEGVLATAGKPHGPYDVIVLEGSVAAVPDALLSQLTPNGRLVATIVEPGKVGVAHLFAKSGKGMAAAGTFDARLPPLLPPGETAFTF